MLIAAVVLRMPALVTSKLLQWLKAACLPLWVYAFCWLGCFSCITNVLNSLLSLCYWCIVTYFICRLVVAVCISLNLHVLALFHIHLHTTYLCLCLVFGLLCSDVSEVCHTFKSYMTGAPHVILQLKSCVCK